MASDGSSDFSSSDAREKVIFFGNGILAEYALKVLKQRREVIFEAHTREDLERAVELKREFPEAHGVLASYGVLIPSSALEVFEPEGILNIHPSLLPLYRGASPIESALLNGDVEFSVSVMKLVKAMDAGPIYFSRTFSGAEIGSVTGVAVSDGAPVLKSAIYQVLAETGAEWLATHFDDLGEGALQDESKATFTSKLEKAMGILTPEADLAAATYRKIVAFQGFPKARFSFYGVSCIVLEAHVVESGETAPLTLKCADGAFVAIDRLQPEGRKAMDAKSFLNGYAKGK